MFWNELTEETNYKTFFEPQKITINTQTIQLILKKPLNSIKTISSQNNPLILIKTC